MSKPERPESVKKPECIKKGKKKLAPVQQYWKFYKKVMPN